MNLNRWLILKKQLEKCALENVRQHTHTFWTDSFLGRIKRYHHHSFTNCSNKLTVGPKTGSSECRINCLKPGLFPLCIYIQIIKRICWKLPDTTHTHTHWPALMTPLSLLGSKLPVLPPTYSGNSYPTIITSLITFTIVSHHSFLQLNHYNLNLWL